jgi:CTP:molybdopterin cytidylyltransferase MocA
LTAGLFIPVRDALVLAAGNGDRFHDGSRQSKLLQPIPGEPIILRTLTSAHVAGITRVEVVLGHQAVRLIDTMADRQHAESLLGERAQTA